MKVLHATDVYSIFGVRIRQQHCSQTSGFCFQSCNLPFQLDVFLLQKCCSNCNFIFFRPSRIARSFRCKIVFPSTFPIRLIFAVLLTGAGITSDSSGSGLTRVGGVTSGKCFLLGQLSQHVLSEQCVLAQRFRVNLQQFGFVIVDVDTWWSWRR